VAVEAIKYLPVGAVAGCRLVDHHYVQSLKLRLVESKRLPNNTFYSVSPGGRAAILFCDCQAQSGWPALVVAAQHGKAFVPAARRLIKDTTVRGSAQQPVFFAKSVGRAAG
jgi:hypothetical protein